MKERCPHGHLIAEVGRASNGHCRACHNESGRARRRRRRRLRNPPVGENEVLLVDARPFVRWLRPLEKELGRAELAQRLGFDERAIYRLLSEGQRQVHIDTVDRALVRAGQHLRDLYPELYDLPALDMCEGSDSSAIQGDDDA